MLAVFDFISLLEPQKKTWQYYHPQSINYSCSTLEMKIILEELILVEDDLFHPGHNGIDILRFNV